MAYKHPDAVLMLFCKAPVAGQVKTRLMTLLSAEEAVQVHSELAQRTLQLAAGSRLCPVQLWCAPTVDHAFFTAAAQRYPLTLELQQGAGLGARMHHAFVQAFKHYARAVIIGCDCPSLTGQDLDAALTALNQPNCCVLAPAEDGGYVLIGLNQAHPELFADMPWGTSAVLELTRARSRLYQLHPHELNGQWDVDNPQDLIRYQALKQNSQGRI